jgi:hypothetical protein
MKKQKYKKGEEVLIKDYENTKNSFGVNDSMKDMIRKSWKIEEVESDAVVIKSYYWHPKDIEKIVKGNIKLKSLKDCRFDVELLEV